jgi:cysteine sulfinate desulfinase/cysteine desulfurase-like protein
MSVSDDLAQGAIRISFGLDNDEDDLHFLCEKLEQEINRLRQYAAVI